MAKTITDNAKNSSAINTLQSAQQTASEAMGDENNYSLLEAVNGSITYNATNPQTIKSINNDTGEGVEVTVSAVSGTVDSTSAATVSLNGVGEPDTDDQYVVLASKSITGTCFYLVINSPQTGFTATKGKLEYAKALEAEHCNAKVIPTAENFSTEPWT